MSCSRTFRVWTVLVGVTLAAACGGGDSDSPTALPTVPDPSVMQPVVSVEVSSPAEPTALGEPLQLGETLQLSVEALDENGQAVAGVEFSWESSNPSVATVDATGLVTGVAEGTATITASAGDVQATVEITVVSAMQPVVSVEVSPSAETIAIGTTRQLSAEAFDENGQAVAGVEFSWESGDAAVATVNASGLVTGVAEGSATIFASAGSVQGRAAITVVSVTQPVVSVQVSPSAETIAIGTTVQLSAEAFDGNGDVVAGVEFSWESGDAAVATVNASGLVTGVAAGMVTITARSGGARGTADITVQNPVASPDREVLVALYNATDGPNWSYADNWVTDAPLGNWSGVEVDARGRVTALDLSFSNLSGPILPDLGNLTNLETLHLGYNDNLSGPIPPELGNLANLRVLRLGHSNLSGPIPPELGNLTNLTHLRLDYSELSGPIPPELLNLTDLTDLWLGDSNLSGPIPPELGNFTSLEYLYLSHSNLSGPIPPELGNLANLSVLRLSTAGLSGPIPPELGNLTSLYWLDLGGNLSGPIPPELGNLANLTELDLRDSNVSGPLPSELGSLTNLRALRLDGNELTSPIPQSFLALDMLTRFSFSNNAGLCAPNTTEFVTWLQSIDRVSGPFCSASSSAPHRLGSRPDAPRAYGGG